VDNRPDLIKVNELFARILELGKYDIAVGVPASKSARGDESELNNAQIAAVNELGSTDGRIPERSFIRSTLTENRNKYARMMGQVARRVSEGQDAPAIALHRVGFIISADVKHKIATGPFIPNAPSTIKRKKSNKPLIDKGQLVQSIDHVIKKRGA
jgi:hypothetical protein